MGGWVCGWLGVWVVGCVGGWVCGWLGVWVVGCVIGSMGESDEITNNLINLDII